MAYRRRYKKRFRKGVPKGYRHIWGYKGRWDEKKIRPGLWKFNFRATKGRRHRGMGSFGVGTKGAWKIRGIQYIKKTGKNTYQTNLKGTKVPMRFYVRRPT